MHPKVQVIKATQNSSKYLTHNNLKKVAAYCRVSTDMEDQINSYRSQKNYYEQYIKNQSNWSLVDIYADEAITGTKTTNRVNFLRMIDDCCKGKIDMVLTKSISRFARNTIDTLTYVRKLKELNVTVFFEEENINTMTMDGELLLTILSSVAQQEVENISANVKKGLKMKMQQGKLVGQYDCYGYVYDYDQKKLVIHPEQSKIIRFIFEKYLLGWGCRKIALYLTENQYPSPRNKKQWHDTTIHNILKNEKYKGDVLQGKTYSIDPINKKRILNQGQEDKFYLENAHEGIVSKTDFDLVQNLLRSRGKFSEGKRNVKIKRDYPFSGKIECAFCGSNFVRKHINYKKTKEGKNFSIVWACSNAAKKGKKYCPHSKAISESTLEQLFIDSLKGLYTNKIKQDSEIPNKLYKLISQELDKNVLHQKLKKLNKKLDTLLYQEKNLLQLKLDNLIDLRVYKEKYNEYQRTKLDLLEQKQLLLLKMDETKVLAKRLKNIKNALKLEQNINACFDGEIFKNVIEKVIIGQKEEDNSQVYKVVFYYKSNQVDEKAIVSVLNKEKKSQYANGACGDGMFIIQT